MRFITCASYYGSGSSAVTDFVSEFENVKSLGKTEFRFVHDPDGIADLEYNLVENFNRHNSGHAIKRYQKLVKYYNGNVLSRKYTGIFGKEWEKRSNEYIEQLTDFTYRGWWLYDLLDKGKIYCFVKRMINKILRSTIWKKQSVRSYNAMKNEITYCSHPSKEKFLSCTKDYINKLFETIRENHEIVMVDQIVPSSNFERYVRYFDDIQVVIVDRDPRDIFLLEKNRWKDGAVPTDAEAFCKWYLYTRENGKHRIIQNDRIHYLQFEDMIYHYDETAEKLMKWLGLKPEWHTSKQKYFCPEKSINNTRLWEKEKCDFSEVRYIEEHLKKYLYNPEEKYE